MPLFLKAWVPEIPEIGLFGTFNIFIDVVKVNDFTKPSDYKILLFCTYWKILDLRPSEAKLDLVLRMSVHVFAHLILLPDNQQTTL